MCKADTIVIPYFTLFVVLTIVQWITASAVMPVAMFGWAGRKVLGGGNYYRKSLGSGLM